MTKTPSQSATGLYAEISTIAEPLETPHSALAIGAHPDDIEFGAGGTLARWAKAGCRVTMLIVTDGSKGTWDPEIKPADLVATRREEQLRAAAVLGATEVRHLDRVDGELEYTMELRAAICRHIREIRPDVVFTHDPWQRYQLHPDHRATGWVAMDAVIAARDHLFFPDQNLAPHRPESVLLWSAEAPDHWEDIVDSFAEKVEALLCHSSQGTTTMGGAEQTEDQRQSFVARLSRWAAEQGKPVGLEAAEAFKRIKP
jgi:LmbE family N-acetylglucosaminyl deacetylase